MSLSLNTVVFSGNLVKDPELRQVGAESSVCSFTVANSSRYKAADGTLKERVAYLDCSAWNRQGEIAAEYLTKGSGVVVEGSIEQDNWTDKEGQKRSKLKLRVDKVHLMPKRSEPVDSSDNAPAAPTRPAAGGGSGDNEPPFNRSEHEAMP